MAGNADCEWTMGKNVVEKCRQLASKIGCHDTDSRQLLAALRKMPAELFATGLAATKFELTKMIQLEIGPRFDGDFFPKPIDQLRNEAPIKRRLVGTALDEGLLFGLAYYHTLLSDRIRYCLQRYLPAIRLMSKQLHELSPNIFPKVNIVTLRNCERRQCVSTLTTNAIMSTRHLSNEQS